MTPSVAALLCLALLGANLPFLCDRLACVLPLPRGKGAAWRLVEMTVMYFAVGGLAYLLEQKIGQPQTQGWEFYAVTGCMFVVLAFPGFAYRYLWRRRPTPGGHQPEVGKAAPNGA